MPDASATPSGFDYFSAESVAQAVREQREKCRVLHEERGKAFYAMREATDQHKFLVAATRVADAKESELRHRLEELCVRQAMELIA